MAGLNVEDAFLNRGCKKTAENSSLDAPGENKAPPTRQLARDRFSNLDMKRAKEIQQSQIDDWNICLGLNFCSHTLCIIIDTPEPKSIGKCTDKYVDKRCNRFRFSENCGTGATSDWFSKRGRLIRASFKQGARSSCFVAAKRVYKCHNSYSTEANCSCTCPCSNTIESSLKSSNQACFTCKICCRLVREKSMIRGMSSMVCAQTKYD